MAVVRSKGNRRANTRLRTARQGSKRMHETLPGQMKRSQVRWEFQILHANLCQLEALSQLQALQ